MLKDVPVGKLWPCGLGCFHNSPLHNIELEYILSHVVVMSQRKGEWVTEFTQDEFLKDFNPDPIGEVSSQALTSHFFKLIKMGYLEYKSRDRKIAVTQKFENLCRAYAS